MELFKYKCPMCGGELNVNEEITVGICQYCNSTIAIPKNLGERSQMYNRAIYLRQNNEFDRAISVYEDMLKRDNTDVEAHFGLFLSKYGIEYVEDPRTRERKPTCHRLQTRSVYADSDYKAAIEYADPMSRDVYESEAARINAIVKRIQELAANEKPYDIFICYKETDIGDERTEDSRIAQELYQRLERKGYRVFFARKTLENQLGSEYEPVIFSAINTAQVMIVLGTKKEYFNAVWVRNEWSRYIELVAENPEKVLIPVYKNMSAYDLPDELAVFQSQDMGRLGFMEDLQDAIEKILHKTHTPVINQSVYSERTKIGNITDLEILLKNANTMFSLGEVDQARQKMQALTEQHPDDYRTWLGYAMVLSEGFQKDVDEGGGITRSLKNAFQVCPETAHSKLYSSCGRYIMIQYEKLDRIKDQASTINENLRRQMQEKEEQILLCKQKEVQIENKIAKIELDYQSNGENIKKCEQEINSRTLKESFSGGYAIVGVLGVIAYIILGFVTFSKVGFWEGLAQMIFIAPILVGLGVVAVGLILSIIMYVYGLQKKHEFEEQLNMLRKESDTYFDNKRQLQNEKSVNENVHKQVIYEMSNCNEEKEKSDEELKTVEYIYNDFFPLYQKMQQLI